MRRTASRPSARRRRLFPESQRCFVDQRSPDGHAAGVFELDSNGTWPSQRQWLAPHTPGAQLRRGRQAQQIGQPHGTCQRIPQKHDRDKPGKPPCRHDPDQAKEKNEEESRSESEGQTPARVRRSVDLQWRKGVQRVRCGDFNGSDDLLDHLIRGETFEVSFRLEQDPVPQNREGRALDVIRQHIVAAVHAGGRARDEQQADGRARACAQ